MEFNRTASNPMLVGCIQLLQAENSPEHREMFIEELEKAVLQAPAIVRPAPVQDENGELTILPGSRIEFPMLATPDGKKYFMGFTDPVEYRLWEEKNAKMPIFLLRFEDYANMVLRPDNQGNDSGALGVVINCYGANVVVPKDMIAGMMIAKMGMIRPIAKNKKTEEAAAPKERPEEAE